MVCENRECIIITICCRACQSPPRSYYRVRKAGRNSQIESDSFHSRHVCSGYTIYHHTRKILILVHRQIKDERSHEQRATFMRTNLFLHSEISSYKTSCRGCHDTDSPSISMSFLSINQISLASISQSKKLLHCGARYPMCHFPRIGCLLSQLKTLIHCEASYLLCYFPIIGGLPDNHDRVSI